MPASLSSPLSKALAETMATGASLRRWRRSVRMVSQPSMPGIARSIRMASTCCSCSRPSAAAPEPACTHLEAQRLQPARQQRAVDLFVVDHQHAPPRAGIADARAAPAARAAARPAARAGTGGCGTACRCAAAVAATTVISPPIRSVSILAMVRPRPVPPLRRRAPAAAWAPRAKGSKMRSRSAARDAGAGVLDLEHRHLAHMRDAKAHAARRGVNLTALPSTLMRIWRQPPLVGAHQRRAADCDVVLEAQALGRGLQLEHAARSRCSASRSRSGLRVQRQLAGSRCARCPACLRSAPSRCSPPRRITPTACLRCAGIEASSSQQLRVAQDAVQRRAQLVADGRDVARLGLVGGVGARAWRCCSCFVGAAVRCRSPCTSASVWRLDSSCATRRLLCVSTSHQPIDAAHQQQRAVGLDEAARAAPAPAAARGVAAAGAARRW